MDDTVDQLSEAIEESESDGESESEPEERGDETDADGTANATADASGSGDVGVREARRIVEDVAEELVGRPLDGIVAIEGVDGGWRVVVEVVERRAIPDTQDILGRYVVSLAASGEVEGYGRNARYRRGDTDDVEGRSKH